MNTTFSPTSSDEAHDQDLQLTVNSFPAVRTLTDLERLELRRDMIESSAWAKKELSRRRKNKEKKSLPCNG